MAIRRYSTAALYSAQLAIIRDLLALEDNLRQCRTEATSLRARANKVALAAKGDGRPLSESEKHDATRLLDEASEYAFAVRLLRYGRWVYRYVGDVIAWRTYGFHREAIRALAAKEPVPFISKKEGIDKELNIFKAIRRLGPQWLPILHDLTNCLRTADFSVFKGRVLYRVFELKIRTSTPETSPQALPKKRGDARQWRQQKRLEDIGEFMQTGDLGKLSPDLAGGRSIRTSIPERYNFPAISKAIRRARRSGFGVEQLEHGILYLAWDSNKNPIEEALRHARNHYPHVFDTLFTFRSINPRYKQYHQSLPITAMDLPPKDIVNLLFGEIGLICLVNFSCVEEWCHSNGVPLSFDRSRPGQLRIAVDMKPYPGIVAEGLWDRLMLEGLSLTSFTNLIQAIMAEFAPKE
jgi:hypothetical protein